MTNWDNKDRRISWLSVFSTLTQAGEKNAEAEAFRVVDALFAIYSPDEDLKTTHQQDNFTAEKEVKDDLVDDIPF